MKTDKPTTYKEDMMGPDSVKWLSAIKFQILSITKLGTWHTFQRYKSFLKVNGSINRHGCDFLYRSSTYRKIVYNKVQRVDYDKIRSSISMLAVYMDYSSSYYGKIHSLI
jgi:N-glycosylase/DNA lyase